MTDWITQEDWSTVKVGDQVRARTDDGDQCTGKVEFIFYPTAWGEVDRVVIDSPSLADLTDVRKDVWTLFVPAKPAVVLPTEPGHYLDSEWRAWTLKPEDESFYQRWYLGDEYMLDGRVKEFAPFTKLEPVAVTAKKFVEAYRAYSSGTNRTAYLLDQAVREVASKEFGADE